MENKFSSMLAYRGALYEAPPHAAGPAANGSEKRFEVTVLFTGIPYTLQALKQAADLAKDLNARVRLIVPQVVPYPLPLESPPVLIEFNENRFHVVAASQAVETRVEIYLCRDVDDMLDEVLTPGSMVVVGGRKRWWPTAEESLARGLRRHGHEVIFAEADVSREGRVYA